MAKFRLKAGEHVIEPSAIVDPKDAGAFQTLLLTDKRVVLQRNVPIKLPCLAPCSGRSRPRRS